jgi:tetratricopeptide (TPR) repeat protein
MRANPAGNKKLRRKPNRSQSGAGRQSGNGGAAPSPVIGRPPDARQKWLALSIGALLFVAVLAVFYPLTGGGFIDYDDNDYVTANAHVQGVFGWKQVVWAFTNTDAANWHPLTWLSHILDYQVYGLDPWGHHLTSVLIHAANAALVFWVLRAMTATFWRSLFAALLFAMHPLRVESVAWIAERKDVLGAMFWLLSMLAYAGYVKNKSSRPRRAMAHYWLALSGFILGMMSKPMVVTLPFAFLLADYWPLQRMRQGNFARLVWEKTPFFLVAALGSVAAFLAQKSQGAVIDFLPLSYRAATAVLAYGRYLKKFLWPVDLAILYPHPKDLPEVGFLVVGALLAALTVMMMRARRLRPYCLMGWLWYLGTLVPVIGLVQIGSQSMADRYTYIPGIGLAMIFAWGACDLAKRINCPRFAAGLGATAVIAGCVALTRHQIPFWKDSGAVFSHAIAVTDNAYMARKGLADFYWSQHRAAEAVAMYKEALEIYPRYEDAHLNLGAVYSGTGHPVEAGEEFKEAIRIKPDDAHAYNDLGAVLGEGHMDESIALFQKALSIDPNYVDAHKNLGQALDSKGRLEEAVAQYEQALRLRPDPDTQHLLDRDLEKLRQTPLPPAK